MPTIHIRIGVPSVAFYKITGKEDNEDFLNTQYFYELTPTTGPIKFEEAWSKTEIVTTTVRFDVLSCDGEMPSTGDLISLRVIMPPDSCGNSEILYVKFARVEKVSHVLSTKYTPEYYNYEIICAKDSIRTYEEPDGNGFVLVSPNNGPDYLVQGMKEQIKKLKEV